MPCCPGSSALGGAAVPLGFRSPSLTPAQAAAADELAELAREVIVDGERSDLDALQRALDAATDSPAVLVAAFTDLGGDGDRRAVRAPRQGLERRGRADRAGHQPCDRHSPSRRGRPGSRAAFAAGRSSTGSSPPSTTARADPAAAMSFLFHDVTFGSEFLVATTRQVVEHEQAALRDEHGFPLWIRGSVGSVLNRVIDDDGDDHAAPGWVRSEDPMYAILESLAGDGDAGRAVFTDDELASVPARRAPVRARRAAGDLRRGGHGGGRARRRRWRAGRAPRRRRRGRVGLRQPRRLPPAPVRRRAAP